MILFVVSLVSGPGLADNDITDWLIRGEGTIVASTATLAQLTGLGLTPSGESQEHITLFWPEALLEAEGRAPRRIRMEIELMPGRIFEIGTQYPGLITKLDDVRGNIVDLETNRVARLRLSERGTWIGKLIHSETRGADHLAAEIPFSLYDQVTGLLIAESNLLVGFDLTDRKKPLIPATYVSPTPFSHLRLQTADLGKALQGNSMVNARARPTSRDVYDAQSTSATMRAIAERNPIADMFDPDSHLLYGCATGEFMELELQSPGFTQYGQLKTPPFTLRVRFAPAMADGNEFAYLEPVTGNLILHHEDISRVIEVGPGNHGHVASAVSISGRNLKFELGIALAEGSAAPVVARLDLTCDLDDGSVRCNDLKLGTAIDAESRIISARALSTLLERPLSLVVDLAVPAAKAGGQQLMGESPGCPFLFPNCMTEGCAAQTGLCWTAGAPIGCTAGCDHHPDQVQCCRGGSSRVCCVPKCGTPQ